MSYKDKDREFYELLREAFDSEYYVDPDLADPQSPDPPLSPEEAEVLENLPSNPWMEGLAQLWACPASSNRRVDRQYEFAIRDVQGFLSTLAAEVCCSRGNITFCTFAIRTVSGRPYFAGIVRVDAPQSRSEEMDWKIQQLQEQFEHAPAVFDELDRVLGIRQLASQETPGYQYLSSSEPSDARYELFTLDREGILKELLLEIWEEGTVTFCAFARLTASGGPPYLHGIIGVQLRDGCRLRLDERLARKCEDESWESLEPVAA